MSWHVDETKLALAKLRKVMKKYKRARHAAAAAIKLHEEVTELVRPYCQASELLCKPCSCAGRLPGAGGVCAAGRPVMENSFTVSGTNNQCFTEPEKITVFREVQEMLAEMAEAVKVADPEWPKECEVVVMGECPNPRLLVGNLWVEGRKGLPVAVWKGWRPAKAGVVVKCELERGGREALYRQVVEMPRVP